MKDTIFYNAEYYLKYKDEKVLKFNISRQTVDIINKELLPVCIRNMQTSFDMIKVFCANRILMKSRVHCKEILALCDMSECNDIIICIMCKALSLTDDYWITSRLKAHKWSDVSLHKNSFSDTIAKAALTGNIRDMNAHIVPGDKILTGELTVKGTKAKCFCRYNDNVLLIKNETLHEINAEVLSYYIATLMRVKACKYIHQKVFDIDCSICKIETSEHIELLSCRDIMLYYNEFKMQYNSRAYNHFLRVDEINFLKMQIFDFITMNIDRNRDNFGLLVEEGKESSLYPLFDHNGCFKGRSTKAVYFVTGMSFEETLHVIKLNHDDVLKKNIYSEVENLKDNIQKNFCLKYISEYQYNEMKQRIELVLKQ